MKKSIQVHLLSSSLNHSSRERSSYLCVWITGFVIVRWPKLGYRMDDITDTSVPQDSLLKIICSLVIQHFTKIMITEKSKTHDYRKAGHIEEIGYIDEVVLIGESSSGLVFNSFSSAHFFIPPLCYKLLQFISCHLAKKSVY